MKRCSKCGGDKSLDDFSNDKRSPTGKHSWCKKCRSDYNDLHRIRSPYNPEKRRDQYLQSPHLQNYEIRLSEQNGLCALCKQPPANGEKLVTDHNHDCCPGEKSCGKCIRGLIHAHCNCALGFLRDDPKLCRLAAEYLERTAPNNTSLRIDATPQLPTGSIGETNEQH